MPSDRALLVAAGGGIGDTLLAGVVAQALHSRYAQVDALVLPAHRALAEHVPAIDRVHVLASPVPTAEDLRGCDFAAAVVTWATFTNAVVPAAAAIPVRVGQARRLYSWLFTERVVVRSERGDHRTHWTQILLDYARALGCDVPDARPAFAPNENDRRAAAALLAARGIDGPFAMLHPSRGLSAQRERWPAAGFIALGRSLRERDGLPLLISGTSAEMTLVEAIARGADAIPVAGATAIGTFAALAERARYVVAMDSGPMHVAAAVGAPTVGIRAAIRRTGSLGSARAAHRRRARGLPVPALAPQGNLPRFRLRTASRHGRDRARARRTAGDRARTPTALTCRA